jgi:hypothetical protein
MPLPRLENRTPFATGGLSWSDTHGGALPTGASKWNPIEHRLFSEISKNWAGEPLDSYQKILGFIRSTSTQTGLSVTAYLDRRSYPVGAEPTSEELEALPAEAARGPAQMELYDLTKSVRLFLCQAF